MPTHEESPQFLRDYRHLTEEQQALFWRAVEKLREDLDAGRPPREGLRVKGVQSRPGIYELTWAPDGRAFFQYGPQKRPEKVRVMWLRIGTHDIFGNR